MIYFLWAILNFGLFILFVFICVKATKLLKEKFGLLISIFFAIGLLSFIGRSYNDNENKEPNSNLLKTWKFNSLDSLDKNSNDFIDIDLEKTWISKYTLGISYGKDKQQRTNIPVSANTWTTGFISGTSWRPISILVNRTEDNQKFKYEVNGSVKWSLLGITIYSQSKNWQGVVLLK